MSKAETKASGDACPFFAGWDRSPEACQKRADAMRATIPSDVAEQVRGQLVIKVGRVAVVFLEAVPAAVLFQIFHAGGAGVLHFGGQEDQRFAVHDELITAPVALYAGRRFQFLLGQIPLLMSAGNHGAACCGRASRTTRWPCRGTRHRWCGYLTCR